MTTAERVERSRGLIVQLAALWGADMTDMDVNVLDVVPELYDATTKTEGVDWGDVIKEAYPDTDVMTTVLTIFPRKEGSG